MVGTVKFLGAIAVYLLFGLILATGIVLATHGTFWLLILAAVIYLAAFARLGCTTH